MSPIPCAESASSKGELETPTAKYSSSGFAFWKNFSNASRSTETLLTMLLLISKTKAIERASSSKEKK